MNERRAEVFRFAAVGLCVSVVFGFAVYLALRAGLDGAWANVAAYTVSTPVAYFGQSRFTFRKFDRPFLYGGRFLIAVAVVNALIHTLGRAWPSEASEAPLAFLSWALLTVGNFTAFKFWVFR